MAKKTAEIVRCIVDALGWQKMNHSNCLTDFDPLITVMCLVANEIGENNLAKPKGKRVWLKAMKDIQDDDVCLENNPYIPCRTCNQAFEPLIDESLFALFLAWYKTRRATELIAIHKCRTCGGMLNVIETKTYKGDMHTPEPGSAKTDEHWAEMLLEHCDA